jgi:hypothetical protein
MAIAEKLDEYGKGAWIALTILGFWLFWPIGLTTLIFLMCTGRTRAWKQEARGRWYNMEQNGGGGCGWGGRRQSRHEPSGNVAFDEYRRETLRRLEEEQREFREYLDRLRAAKDKAEFDQFMADRRPRPDAEAA